MILNIIFSGDGINTTEEDIEDMTSKSKPPGRVKIPLQDFVHFEFLLMSVLTFKIRYFFL